jgi:hypothetical protein
MAAVSNPLRLGKISSIKRSQETAEVVYEDRENTSADLPFLAWESWTPKVGDRVLVGSLSTGSGSAVILGPIGSLPDKRLKVDDLQDQINKLKARVTALESRW